MANSRLEKIGTIYSRTRGLLQSGALNFNDRPLWYDIYEAFPPQEEPYFSRPAPNVEVRGIFYKEDKIRVLLHNHVKRVGITNLLNPRGQSYTQKFIQIYEKLDEQYGSGTCDSRKLFNESMDMFKREKEAQLLPDDVSDMPDGILTSAFKSATMQQKQPGSQETINVKKLFSE